MSQDPAAVIASPSPESAADPFNFPQQELWRYGDLLVEGLDRMRLSGQVILGEGVRRFEQAFAAWLGGDGPAPEVIGVGNGTDALELALRCSGVQAGDRVLLPSHTAYATLAAVLRIDAVPVFVDLEPGRAVLAPDHVDALLSGGGGERPRALIAVHLYGEACDLDALGALCDHHGVALIEDCAQASGTLYGGRPVGTHGRFAAFSFYPTKNLAAFGDGGALVVNRPEDGEWARRSRFYGWDQRREAVHFGINSRLDELQAYVLLGKLPHLEQRIRERRQVAAWYSELLRDLVGLPPEGALWRHSFHLYVVEVEKSLRDPLLAAGCSAGLPLAVHYPLPCHRHPHVIERFGPTTALPRTEELVARILSLPLHPYLPRTEVERVCERLVPLLAGGGRAGGAG